MGRILAIDYGTKRTGIAVSDPLRLIAGGLGTVAIAALGMLLLPWRTAPVLLAIPLVFAVLLAADLFLLTGKYWILGCVLGAFTAALAVICKVKKM